MSAQENQPQAELNRLVEVMRKLRAPDGCPWDREQTHETLIPHLVEELYEVVDAIKDGDANELAKELGDLLLQVVFHAQLAAETGAFDLTDVIKNLTDKLIHRHPHVFGDKKGVETAADVKKVWTEQKKKEGKKTVLGGVPRSMPALHRAWRLSDKAATVGFDWPDAEAVWQKHLEETNELREALDSGDTKEIEHELGDVLCAVVNLSRKLGIDPEIALQKSNERFVSRFNKMEENAGKNSQSLSDFDLETLEAMWQEAKQQV